MSLKFHLLDELEILRDGKPLPLPPYRVHGFLAALLLHPRPHRRERLVGQLFPDLPESDGRKRLSDHLWLLRRSLPHLALESDRSELFLPPESRWLDVEAFRRTAARPDLNHRMEALALYRGDLLASVYDDWLLEEREALYLQYIRLAHCVCEELYRQRRIDDLLPLAEHLVQREPFDEKALRILIVTLTNTLLVSFTNGFAGGEWMSGDVVVWHSNTLPHQVTNLEHVLDGSPTFTAVDGVTGDPRLDADYHLLPGSAAIDAGADAGVTTDLDGDDRPSGGGFDIGADEFATFSIYLPLALR